jgi:hypothetical protein
MGDLENLIGAFVLILAKNGGSITLSEEDFKNAEDKLGYDIALEVEGGNLVVKLLEPEPQSKIIKPKLEIVK